jgi:hypothetical protein
MSVKTPVGISKNGSQHTHPVLWEKKEVFTPCNALRGGLYWIQGPCLPLPHETQILVKPRFGPTLVSTHYNKKCPTFTI